MSKLQELRSRLRLGKVYRREDLTKWSTSVDRHLKQMVEAGELTKLSGGVYYYPKETAFGKAPAEDKSLVEAFLKDDRFLLTSPNAHNAVAVGATQLYNETVVYNHKRHGQFKLGGRMFDFRVKPHFPKVASKEFLLVDLVNNVNQLAEDKQQVLEQVRQQAARADRPALQRAVRDYGAVRTRKFFSDILTGQGQSSAA
jgi:hypothetical protein